jgi:hypothetical protein
VLFGALYRLLTQEPQVSADPSIRTCDPTIERRWEAPQMKLKILLVTALAVAGIGASYAVADDGHGKRDAKQHCQQVHVNGTVAPQTLTVTLNRDARRLNLQAGSQVTVQVGTAGQTVRFNAEACSTTSGSATQLAVKSAELRAVNPKPAPSTTQTTTTS